MLAFKSFSPIIPENTMEQSMNKSSAALLSILIISSSAMAQTPAGVKSTPSTPLMGSIQAGAGFWMGNATYSIGGEAWTPETGSIELPDKISELKFPLDVVYGSVAGNLILKNRVEIFGTFMANLTEPSSKMEDSDWGVFEESDSDTLDIYSESDAELSAMGIDVGARYWFRPLISTNRFGWSIGVGPALLYQHLDWTISNVDQSYPSHPEWGHDTEAGLVGTYNSDIVMPYVNACFQIRYKKLSGRAEAGLGPALVQDEDDHILREKRASADMAGIGTKGTLELQYNLTQHLFALARVSLLFIGATGTSTQEGYGGDMTGFYAEVEEDFSMTAFNSGLALGYGF